jgi:predicted RNase H-like HicB family nuclease
MKITRELIDSGASSAGGWNKPQLALLGVPWPPERGWPQRIIGTQISEESAAEFVKLKGSKLRKPKPLSANQEAAREHFEVEKYPPKVAGPYLVSTRQKPIVAGQNKLGPFEPPPGERLTIRVDWDKGWKAAICEEMEVSGFGTTVREALEACGRSIESCLLAIDRRDRAPSQSPEDFANAIFESDRDAFTKP